MRVDLGLGDILRIRHSIRTGTSSAPMSIPVNALRRTAGDATSILLHEIFNHCSSTKIFHTLGATKGYRQVRLLDFHCPACALGKARGFGLQQTSRKKVQL